VPPPPPPELSTRMMLSSSGSGVTVSPSPHWIFENFVAIRTTV
jgi:hypothetical protein